MKNEEKDGEVLMEAETFYSLIKKSKGGQEPMLEVRTAFSIPRSYQSWRGIVDEVEIGRRYQAADFCPSAGMIRLEPCKNDSLSSGLTIIIRTCFALSHMGVIEESK